MAILSPSDLRTLGVETDLTDDALQVYLDDAEAAIVRFAGATGSLTKEFRAVDIGGDFIFLSPPATAITSVTEVDASGGTTALAATTDYVSLYSGRVLQRVNCQWSPSRYCSRNAYVRVVYTAAADAALRKRVQADLVRLALTYRGGIKSESDGDFSASANSDPGAYENERRSILSALQTPGMVIA